MVLFHRNQGNPGLYREPRDRGPTAACFRREQKLVEGMSGLPGGYRMGEMQARNLGKPEIRRGLIALIERCAEADREAAKHIKEALEGV